MLRNYIGYFALLFVYSAAAADVDLAFLTPCKLDDVECLRQLWQDAVPFLSRGVPELDLAPLDPLKLQDIKVVVPNLIEFNFIEGLMKGYKTCIVYEYKWTTIKKGRVGADIDLHCNITIKGRYNATASTSVIPGLASDESLKADGDMKMKIFNLKIKFILDLKVIRNEQNDIVLSLQTPIQYKYETHGPVAIKANKISLGNQDISELAVNLLNANWRYLIDNFSGPFFKRAMEIIGDVEKSFFLGVPVAKYIEDNMEQYLV